MSCFLYQLCDSCQRYKIKFTTFKNTNKKLRDYWYKNVMKDSKMYPVAKRIFSDSILILNRGLVEQPSSVFRNHQNPNI